MALALDIEAVVSRAIASGATPKQILSVANGNPEVIEAIAAIARKGQRSQLEEVGHDNPVTQVSRCGGHVLIATKTGGGKTTFMEGVIADAIAYFPDCQWCIVTPKSDPFFGWAQDPRQTALTFLDLGDDDWVDVIHDRVGRSYGILSQRIKADQEASRTGREKQEYSPFFLFIDEWFSLWDELKALPPIEYEDESGKVKTVKTRKDLRGDEIIRWLRKIVAMGRALNCFVYLVGQSSNTSEIGFSSQARGNFSFIALGRRGRRNEIGYDPIVKVLNDNWLFPDRAKSAHLKAQLPAVIDQAQALGDRPVALINSGQARLWILPDLSGISQLKIPPPRGL